jgi:hypothetical protein
VVPAWAQESHDHDSEPLGFTLKGGWLSPSVHSHLSPRGTPYIHSFRVEPAFTRRDLLIDYNFRRVVGQDEHEIEAELEWALSRRLGLIFEVPYTCLRDDDGSVSGFGNLAVSPRVLLVESETFLLAFNFEVESPTGNSNRGLAADEVALAPSLSTWIDLGRWWTVNAQAGVEQGLESHDSELFLRASLGHTLAMRDGHRNHRAEDHARHGLPPGFLSLILETDLAVGLAGDQDGDWLAEGIVGLYYGLWENVDVRAAYVFPLSESQELHSGLTAGFLWHF